MTRVQAHGVDRFLQKNSRALLVALDELQPLPGPVLERLANEIVSGGADGLIVTLEQADELSELLPRVAILVRANNASESEAAFRAGLDAVVISKTTLIPAERGASFGVVLAGAAVAGNVDARIVSARAFSNARKGSPVFVRLERARNERELFKRAADLIRRGARGLVAGPTLWEHSSPRALVRALSAVVEGKSPAKAEEILAQEREETQTQVLRAEI